MQWFFNSGIKFINFNLLKNNVKDLKLEFDID